MQVSLVQASDLKVTFLQPGHKANHSSKLE